MPSARPDWHGTATSTVPGGGTNWRVIVSVPQVNARSALVAPAGMTRRTLLTSNLVNSPGEVVDGSTMLIVATGNGDVLRALTNPDTRELSPSTAAPLGA